MDRVFGVRWYIEFDIFGFKVVNLDKGDMMRGVLLIICLVFDFLNLVVLVMLLVK